MKAEYSLGQAIDRMVKDRVNATLALKVWNAEPGTSRSGVALTATMLVSL
jgi:undecaprenyl pyrophosphate phosphatase UppP